MDISEKEAKFLLFRAEGLSLAAIAKRLGISKSTASAWARKHKGELEEAQRSARERLAAAIEEAKLKRFNLIKVTLEGLAAEINTRPLDELNLYQLHLLNLKYIEAQRLESQEPLNTEDKDKQEGKIEIKVVPASSCVDLGTRGKE